MFTFRINKRNVLVYEASLSKIHFFWEIYTELMLFFSCLGDLELNARNDERSLSFCLNSI